MAVEKKERKRKLPADTKNVPNKKKKSEDQNPSPSAEETLSEHNEDEEEETANDSGCEPGEDDMKFSKDFKMLNFRKKLRGQNFTTELRHFLHLAEQKPQIVAKYIEKRGKPLELAEALERVDKTNAFHVSYLCEALQLVVMEILSNQTSHVESAVHACRYFLKSHGSVIESLLQSNNVYHRKRALKLLTAIVCVEPQLGRQVLSSFAILSNVREIEKFLSHSKYDLDESETIRKCYIHFVLAYLVDGNTVLIRNILDKSILIKALASGLLFDDHVTVCLVLNTLKKYILECPEISKTKKIQVFDVDCVKAFARLYDWLGPQALAAKFANRKKSEPELTFDKLKKITDEAEREVVAEAVHKFLITLLTSRKHGITFDAMLHFQQRHNKFQGKIIGFLDKPWLSERKTELILKVLSTCPDVARQTVKHFGAFVNPMRTPQSYWVVTCEFIVKIINELHPSLLKGAVEKITLTDFSHWIKDICLPIEILTYLTGSQALKHARYGHRLTANRLLLAMFRQYANYMSVITEREQQKHNNLRKFKFDLLNHIFVNFPTIEDILYSLYQSIKAHEEEGADEEVNVLEHLEVTLDLVLIICQQNRSFVNKTGAILDYLKLLRPLYSTEEGEGNIKLELKAIKTILLIFPKALEPGEELFANVLKSFINSFVRGDGDIQREAAELLRQIFVNTGIFNNGELEIDLWLEPLRFIDSNIVDIVTAVFIEVLQVTKAEVDASEVENTPQIEKKNLVQLFANIEQGLSVQGYVETLTRSKLYQLIVKGVEIGEELGIYLDLVNLLTIHYMDNWPHKKGSLPLDTKKEVAEMLPHLVEVQSALLSGELKFEDIFCCSKDAEDCFSVHLLGGRDKNLTKVLGNDRMVMIYIQEVIFLVSHLFKTNVLTAGHSKSAVDFMVNLLNIMHALQRSESMSSTSLDENAQENRMSFFESTLKYIFTTRLEIIGTTNIFITDNCTINYLNFIQQTTECVNTLQISNFCKYTTNFRQKVVKSIEMAIIQEDKNVKKNTDSLQTVIRLIETLHLSVENCLEILQCISTLVYTDFIDNTGQKTVFLDILITVLTRIATLQQSVNCKDFMVKISQIYIDLVEKSEAESNLDRFEDALYNFLLICHQNIQHVPSEVFSSIFTHKKPTKSTIRLACLLLERNHRLEAEFLKALPKNISKKELIYPLLNVGIANGIQIEDALLSSIYQEYKNGFMKTIEKPQKAGVIYKDNVETSIHLIESCMPKSECVDFCHKNIKFDSVEIFQIKIIRAIFQKALNSIEDQESDIFSKVFVQFVNLSIQMMTIVVKKDSIDEEKLNLIGYSLFTWFRVSRQNCDFGKVLKSPNWMNFCKASLKTGMQMNETEDNHSAVDRSKGQLLKLLAFLCDRLYDETSEASHEAGQFFDMVFTHSKFYNIVLQVHPTAVKTQLMHLLLVLAKKCPSALEIKQIPVILGAYQAKLSDCDRFTLALLQIYEEADVGLYQYRPFIWGESATAFYSLRDDQTNKPDLERQETSVIQVMYLIDRNVSENTLNNFPIWRRLNPKSQLPAVIFEDPDRRHYAAFGSNFLEKRIEQGITEFEEVELRLCPKRDNLYDECYDPAFIVPLMSICFAPENYSQPVRPVQNGLLAIVFASLSSQDKEMRMAAGCVQLRYRQHFENGKFFEKPLWMQGYDNIQNGLEALRNDWLKHKKNGGIPRVPYISGLFLAKTINITTDPTHVLYKQLTMFLRLKETFNFLCVPEFNVLFHSPEIEHHTFRQFIVKIISDGVKSSSDLFLLVTTSTFKALMGFFGSSMSTLDVNLLILSVLSTCVKIPGSSKIMIEHVGIIPWLNGVLTGIEFYQFDVIEGIISIINNLWYAIKANEKQFHNFQHLQSDINRLILRLQPNLSGRISPGKYAKLLNILNKTSSGNIRQMLSESRLEQLIGCAKKLYGQESLNCVVSIKENGAYGAESKDSFCRSLALTKTEPTTILAVFSLREFVIKWNRSSCLTPT